MENSSENCADLSRLVAGNSNKQPVQEPIIMLPPEILDFICGILCKKDLKQVRQVSKVWERAVVPYLFDEIFISQDLVDFRIAKCVILHFKRYIRTLVFSFVCYRRMDRESFDKEFSSTFNDTGIDNGHSDHAFTVYRIMRKNQYENLVNGSSSAYLSFALTSLPKIWKIILTDTSSSRSMPHQSLHVYQSRRLKACPIKQCDLTAADHLPRAVRQSGLSCKGFTNSWRLVISALSATNANVRELALEPLDSSTKTSGFSIMSRNLDQVQICFPILTKIRLSLFVDNYVYSGRTRLAHRNVAKLLCSAVNVQSLSLDLRYYSDIDRRGYSTLRAILRECEFPKLRSLILACFTSSDEELLRLVKHSKSLEQITIRCHLLMEGSWMQLADRIRASLPLLKHAEFDHIYGGFDEPFKKLEFFGRVRGRS